MKLGNITIKNITELPEFEALVDKLSKEYKTNAAMHLNLAQVQIGYDDDDKKEFAVIPHNKLEKELGMPAFYIASHNTIYRDTSLKTARYFNAKGTYQTTSVGPVIIVSINGQSLCILPPTVYGKNKV